jgi:hypothetical protein
METLFLVVIVTLAKGGSSYAAIITGANSKCCHYPVTPLEIQISDEKGIFWLMVYLGPDDLLV